jgi:hypothetical protein
MGASRRFVRLLVAVPIVGALVLAGPSSAFAHALSNTYQSRLPLIVYLAGAAIAVGLSFAFLLIADVRADPPVTSTGRVLPRGLAWLLRAIGLVGWLWIVAQGIAGGNGAGDVTTLFLWVYGWVGLALINALGGPVWSWLDPFSTIHQLLGWLAGRLGLSGGESAPYPARLGRWPAVIGLAVIVWLELVARVEGGRSLGLFLIGYTIITDGVFRPHRVAREWRDVQRVVWPARPAGAVFSRW